VTELLSTCLILPSCDISTCPTAGRCLIILTVAIFHVIAAGYDQFADNVLLGEGAWHQWSRDLAFMVVDLLHVVIATYWLCQLSRHRSVLSRDEVLLAVISVVLLCVLALVT